MEEISRFAATVSQVHLGAAEEEIGSCLLPIATRLTLLTLPLCTGHTSHTQVQPSQAAHAGAGHTSYTTLVTLVPLLPRLQPAQYVEKLNTLYQTNLRRLQHFLPVYH